jgi:hypothetical protein
MASHSNKRCANRPPFSCAAYYSDGDFHASGMTENFTMHGGCLRGTHLVRVGMQLVVLLIPTAKQAFIINKATVRWVGDAHFGVELNEVDCRIISELGKTNVPRQEFSLLKH